MPAAETRIARLAALRLICARHVGPYEEVGIAWGRLTAWIGRRGLLGPQMTLVGIVYEDPEVTPPEKQRYDAAIAVRADVQPGEGLLVQEIPEAEYAVAMHRGPYSELCRTYSMLCGQYVPGCGRELLTAPSLEFYRNNPMNTRPEDLLTEVWVQLAPQE